MLGRKKSVKNEDWRAMHESVSDIISHSHQREITWRGENNGY